jgi:hypothetical protein
MNRRLLILALIGVACITLGIYLLPKPGSFTPSVYTTGHQPFVQGWAYHIPGSHTVYVFDGGTLHEVKNPKTFAEKWYHQPYVGLPLSRYTEIHDMPADPAMVGYGGPIN